jgi:membrane protein YdbS with pleckstrin-like domain
MTAVQTPTRSSRCDSEKEHPALEPVLQSDSSADPAATLQVAPLAVPERLLDEGEVVYFAIKPSFWYILLVSGWWIGGAVIVVLAAGLLPDWGISVFWVQAAICAAFARIGWAILQWSARLYVLTNQRVMRIRGVYNVNIFECPLRRIQNTALTATLFERLFRIGTIQIRSAGTTEEASIASWRNVPRPVEIHEQLREVIYRAQHRGHHAPQ